MRSACGAALGNDGSRAARQTTELLASKAAAGRCGPADRDGWRQLTLLVQITW